MRNAAMLLLLSTPAFAAVKNFVMIAVDDLRPLFGDAFANPEVLAPNIDRHFLRGGGSAFQHSYVQIAVCGPSRSSILTGRRPDTTTVGVQPGGPLTWCWCQRGKCRDDGLFMTLPAWFARNGYVTAGNGKIFHPDACSTRMGRQHNYGPAFEHISGDDARGWNVPPYGVEGMFEEPFDNATNQFAEEQFGTIPGPNEAIWNNTMGPSWLMSPLADEQQTDGQIATNTISRLTNFSRAGIGKTSGKPFFLATGFHKPHTPYIVPEKYFRLYDLENVSLAPNRFVPKGFKEENWHANGNVEIKQFKNPGAVNEPFAPAVFGFNTPVDNQTARELRRAYFAATSFLDAQVGRVMAAIDDLGFASNTAVALWSDHGYHLGDTNSWCKMTNFEKATRNVLLWRVPGQPAASQGRNERYVEMVDFFPTVIDVMGLPKIPRCSGVDQPPTVLCLQGESYADEFTAELGVGPSVPKKSIFSQWPYSAIQSPGYKGGDRMAYTVRTADGYRLTQYVPYLVPFGGRAGRGLWADVKGTDDLELYDYTTDPHETTNQAANPKYAGIVARLQAVLKEQYDPSE